MPPVNLATLAPDIKDYITRYVTFKDRLNLARSTKEWYRHGIATAYNTVRFACSDETSQARALAMLTPDNEGVKHIRHLTLIASDYESEPGQSDPILKEVLGLFAYLLPAHTLLTLSIDSCHVLDPDLVTVLHRRQRYLQSLRLDGWRTTKDNCLNENLLQEGSLIDISHVSDLRLFISSKWQADWFNIPDLPSLKHLEIHTDLPSIISSDGQDPRDPQQHRRLSQLIIDDVFSADHFHKRLTYLALRGLDLQDAGPIMKPVLHSQALTALTLQQCRNITTFAQYCADDEQLLPVLQTLNIANPSDRPYCLDAVPLNALLTRLSGLVNILLSVTLVSSTQPMIRGLQVKAIVQHAETLRYAYLDLARHDPETFVRRLQGCTKLQQLAIPHLGRPLPLAPTDGSDSLGPAAMETLSALEDLRSLYLLDDLQRADQEGHLSSILYAALRSQRLTEIATDTFDGVKHLNVLGVGRRLRAHSKHFQKTHPDYFTLYNDRVHEVEPAPGSEPPKYFMRAERRDLDGRNTVLATEVKELERVQAVEPYSDVFDVVADSNRTLQQGTPR